MVVLSSFTLHRERLVYASIICVLQQLDMLRAFSAEAQRVGKEDLQFPTAFPIAFSTHMSGRQFRLACLWHSEKVEVCPLLELTINDHIDLKRCFLIRHEVIKIVQDVGVMLGRLTAELPRLPLPREDLWWRRYCCSKVIEGKYILCERCGRWFHWECVKIEKKPSGCWYCSDCASKPKAPELLKASAEPREDRGPPDSDYSPTVAPSLQPIRRLFKVRTTAHAFDEVTKRC
mgnify:CR=1 FL=1